MTQESEGEDRWNQPRGASEKARGAVRLVGVTVRLKADRDVRNYKSSRPVLGPRLSISAPARCAIASSRFAVGSSFFATM